MIVGQPAPAGEPRQLWVGVRLLLVDVAHRHVAKVRACETYRSHVREVAAGELLPRAHALRAGITSPEEPPCDTRLRVSAARTWPFPGAPPTRRAHLCATAGLGYPSTADGLTIQAYVFARLGAASRGAHRRSELCVRLSARRATRSGRSAIAAHQPT